MKNGQLKPAYNLQIGVNSEYIVGLDLFPNPTDVRTLIPFLSVLESKNLKFRNIVADAGYESEENYEYLFNNNYTPYIKPQNYEKQKTRKFKHDISKVENMSFNEETDTYTCANNQKLEFKYTSKQKNRSWTQNFNHFETAPLNKEQFSDLVQYRKNYENYYGKEVER